ncbi:hypothetical protein ACFXJ8_41675 [Nonomuraea sp. NPDC059194]|uniref:hypothetical protein n=1 Tax=Nonomuraea sp. NPDC059194 TaxID=3346764 RepID=UPI0036967A81
MYNGIGAKITDGGGVKQVNKGEYDAYKGKKELKVEKVTEEEYKAWESKYGPDSVTTKTTDGTPKKVGHDYKPGKDEEKILTGVEVSGYDFGKAGADTVDDKNGEQCPEMTVGEKCLDAAGGKPVSNGKQTISKGEYDELVAKKAKGEFLGEVKAENGGWYKQQFFTKQWVVVPAKTVEYFKITGYLIYVDASGTLVDLGRLGDNVGGQGFAYNQPTGKIVRTFGYPYAEHPDGSKPYTGVTPKWCYGKTSAKLVGSAAKKIEEHVALKCPVTPGYDGGPWLLKYSNAKRLGYVNGVTSTFNDQDGNDRVDYISSPYFDGETNLVYKAAANTASGAMFPFPKP